MYVLIKRNCYSHVSHDVLREFENAFNGLRNWEFIKGPNCSLYKFWNIFNKILIKKNSLINLFNNIKLNRSYLSLGMDISNTLPYFLFSSKLKMIWAYDLWEPSFELIEKIINTYKINILFSSSFQSTEYFNSRKINKFMAFWVPEGIDISNYKFINYNERKIDILQIGRRWDEYHYKIVDFCEANNITYLYEKFQGKIIFNTREDFVNGLANSKISICVPSNITHPSRSGNISTLTNRYLQSMASKCLILGIKPYDMNFLFDYEPIIEIDMNDPIGQIMNILNHFDDYIDLIEKNYNYIKEYHQWINRIVLIENYIKQYLNIIDI